MKIYDYKDLTDSKILYDKNPPKIMRIIVLMLAVLFIVLAIFSVNTKKSSIVKFQGSVTSLNKEYVISPVGGSVTESYLQEGKRVRAGNVLAIVRAPDVTDGEKEYFLTALSDGALHLNIPVRPGLAVQAGANLATILGDNDLIIEAYISTADRAKIKINQHATVTVDGLAPTEFGYLNATVVCIDADATIDEKTQSSFYKIKLKLDNKILTGRKGREVSISPGLSTIVSILYDELSYFEYIKEGLGITL